MAEKNTPYAPNNLTERPLHHYLDRLKEADPREIEARTGIPFKDSAFIFRVLQSERTVTWPDFMDEGWKDKEKILFARYLLEGKKVSPVLDFKAYSELPWGEVYDRNFRARCVNRLIGTFGTRPEAYCEACERLGGVKIPGSGLIYEIPFMENLNIRLILWEGDEEFPASGQILFSSNFPEAFAAEDRVIVCEVLLSYLK